jgi:hypothetical protein
MDSKEIREVMKDRQSRRKEAREKVYFYGYA